MKKLSVIGLQLAVLLLVICGQAWGDTKKITGTTNIEDAMIMSANAEKNYGGYDYLYSGVAYATLIRVKNVATELGANATISACVCSVYCNAQTSIQDVSAYRVFKPWVEGDESGVDDDDGDVTWSDWASDAYEWTTAGCNSADDEGVDNSGDGTGADRKATAEDTESNVGSGNWYGFDISASLAQGWYDGTINEEGIILYSGADYQRYSSTEYTSNQPFWVFTYTTGAPPEAGQVIIVH